VRAAAPQGAAPSPILLVEDDPDLRETLADVLSEEGFRVHSAADGLEALALLGQLPRPCVVLLDWLMPRLDGAGLLHRLAERDAFEGLTILVTTNYLGRIPDERVTRVMRKPYDVGDLLQLLDRYCFPAPS
jgi:two-component system, chemotaxis family, chemotaxis protein CheY